MTSSEVRPGGIIARVVGWLRAGYPTGVPEQDYVALLGILRRTLTEDEVDTVVRALSQESADAVLTRPVVEQRIADLVDCPPSEQDVTRVSARLAAGGWPLGDAHEIATRDAAPVAGQPVGGLVGRIVDWLRRGYPTGLPSNDFIPLVALLRRRLTDDEVRQVAQALTDSGSAAPDRVDVGTAIAAVTSELPAEEDLERVRHHLLEQGWEL